MRFRINSTKKLLEIVYGVEDGVSFKTEAGETVVANYKPQSFLDLDMIMSFNRSLTEGHLYGTYYKRPF